MNKENSSQWGVWGGGGEQFFVLFWLLLYAHNLALKRIIYHG
jgi:hypothetical protein